MFIIMKQIALISTNTIEGASCVLIDSLMHTVILYKSSMKWFDIYFIESTIIVFSICKDLLAQMCH